jgi:hypothetical protein
MDLQEDHRQREGREAKAGSYVASRKIKDWTLWSGRPPPKRKITAGRAGAGNVEAPAPNDTEKKTTFNELTEPYRVSLGTSAHRQCLESDHRNPKKKTLQAHPSEEK